MGHLFDRFLFLLRSGAREIKNNLEVDFIPNLTNRILKYTYGMKNLKGEDFEKRFQEFLNKVGSFWKDSKSQANEKQKSYKESYDQYREKAYEEFEKNYQDEFKSEYPEQILKYYKALEIEPIKDKDIIKSQWKKMMRRYHPDLFNDDPKKREVAAELSARLTQAYQEIIEYLGGR